MIEPPKTKILNRKLSANAGGQKSCSDRNSRTGRSRDYAERLSPLASVGREATAIQCEHLVRFQFFSQHNQSRIGKIHRDIAIPFHQRRDPLEARMRRRNQLKSASKDKLQSHFLGTPAGPDQVKRFGKNRLCRNDRSRPNLEHRYALLVERLASIHESYERAGIEQKLSGHGVTGGSGIPDAAGPNQELRFQHCRADRERARLGVAHRFASRHSGQRDLLERAGGFGK